MALFGVPIVIPSVFGILWRRPNTKGVYLCIVLGVVSGILLKTCWKDLSWEAVSEALRGVLLQQDWSSLSHLSGHLVTSFFAGGLILAAVATPCAYFFVLHLVRNYRRVRGIPDIREG